MIFTVYGIKKILIFLIQSFFRKFKMPSSCIRVWAPFHIKNQDLWVKCFEHLNSVYDMKLKLNCSDICINEPQPKDMTLRYLVSRVWRCKKIICKSYYLLRNFWKGRILCINRIFLQYWQQIGHDLDWTLCNYEIKKWEQS